MLEFVQSCCLLFASMCDVFIKCLNDYYSTVYVNHSMSNNIKSSCTPTDDYVLLIFQLLSQSQLSPGFSETGNYLEV